MLSLPGCSRDGAGSRGGAGNTKGQGAPVPVRAAVAQSKTVPVELSAIGNARASASVAIKARVDGQLSQIRFRPGDPVKEGEVIFEIDPRPFQASLHQVRALQARDEASLANARAELRRAEELASTQVLSASLLDASRASVEALRAQVEADKAAVSTAELQLSFCTITAPVSGRMSVVHLDPGNMVRNGETVLAVINQIRPIHVDFSIPESSVAAVRGAMAAGPVPVQASAPNQASIAGAGALSAMDNQVDTTTGTVLLRAIFSNSDEALWPGQFMNVTLEVGRLTNAIVVPSQAVQTGQDGEFVFVVVQDGTVEKRMVKLGPAGRGEAVIESGIKAGEAVVTDGQMRLAPGMKAVIKAAGSEA